MWNRQNRVWKIQASPGNFYTPLGVRMEDCAAFESRMVGKKQHQYFEEQMDKEKWSEFYQNEVLKRNETKSAKKADKEVSE